MYGNTLENRSTYTNQDDIEMVDLSEPIFADDNIYSGISMTFGRTALGMEMRPDLAAVSIYGDEKYTDLLLAYNNIQNPFSIDFDDILIIPSLVTIDKNVSTSTATITATEDDLIREFHKYVSSSKKPDTTGSEKNETSIPKTKQDQTVDYKEANMAEQGACAIQEIDGRLYFGADSGMQCATSGISTSDYLKKVIQNSTTTVK